MRKTTMVMVILMATGLDWLKATSKAPGRLENATFVVNEVMQTPEKGIPRELLDKAVCVGVIPSEKKFAIGVGGTYGRGALVCRKGGDGPWWAPSMFGAYGVNYGLQVGGEATDIVFIVMNSGGMRKLLQSGVKLGVDASAAAGPVGRSAEGATDAQLHAEILSYSRSRGLFAGISLAGAVLRQDEDANEHLYGKPVTAKQILLYGELPPPPAAKGLVDILTKYSPHGGEAFPRKD